MLIIRSLRALPAFKCEYEASATLSSYIFSVFYFECLIITDMLLLMNMTEQKAEIILCPTVAYFKYIPN